MDRKGLIQELKDDVLKGNGCGVLDASGVTSMNEIHQMSGYGEHRATQHSSELSCAIVTSALNRCNLDDESAVKKNVRTKNAVSIDKLS